MVTNGDWMDSWIRSPTIERANPTQSARRVRLLFASAGHPKQTSWRIGSHHRFSCSERVVVQCLVFHVFSFAFCGPRFTLAACELFCRALVTAPTLLSDFCSHLRKRKGESKTRKPAKIIYGDSATIGYTFAATLGRRRSRSLGRTAPAGVSGTAAHGAALHGTAACGAHTANNSLDPRSLFTTGRTGRKQ